MTSEPLFALYNHVPLVYIFVIKGIHKLYQLVSKNTIHSSCFIERQTITLFEIESKPKYDRTIKILPQQLKQNGGTQK
jgi:hypothetical protein